MRYDVRMLNVELPPGKYIVAVSGGVDSVVLLDLLVKQKDLDLVVAHFDHGIRKTSAKDREFVEKLSGQYALPFEYGTAKLGAGASEEQARKARYEFLQDTRKKCGADAIITAHHQDDVIETICINLLRGTGRMGLSSLTSREDIARPLLEVPKAQLVAYAQHHDLQWREDETNQNTDYLRNWLRHKILNKLSDEQRAAFVTLYHHARVRNEELNSLLSSLLGERSNTLQKSIVINAPHDVAKELLAHWLRDNSIRDFDQKTLERLVIGAKTLAKGKTVPIKRGVQMIIGDNQLELASPSSKNSTHSV